MDKMLTENAKQYDLTGFCSYNEYSCLNGKCIPNSLTCDGWDNCGDDSDEIFNCYYHWSIGLQAGVGVGITVFVVLVIFSVSFRIYRRRVYAGTWQRNRAAVVTAQAVMPPQPAGAYPPPASAYPPPAGAYQPPTGAYPGY